MPKLIWDQVGKRFYETGVDRGVLYLPNEAGKYLKGVAWNGLTAVNQQPEGGEDNPQYADNIEYLNLVSAEKFKATIEALSEMRDARMVAQNRGISVEKVFRG